MERVEWGSESVTERLSYATEKRVAMTPRQRAVIDGLPSVINAQVFSLSDLDIDDREAAVELMSQGYTLTEIISSM